MTDLVIQCLELPTDAVDAFKVACVAKRVKRKLNCARLIDIRDDADTRLVAAALSAYWKCDAAFVPPDLKLADFSLLALDMDCTLVSIETLDEVAAFAGKGAGVPPITEAAMRGEIADYRESVRRRVAMLAGTDASLLQRVLDEKLQLNAGAEELIRACQAAGLKTLLVTAGFTLFTATLKQRLGIDFTSSNGLEIIDGKLTGRVIGPPENDREIVDADGKVRALREACAAIGCPTERVIAIGDGANALKMMELAGLSVAYRAKPAVQAQADQALNHAGLDGVLNWFA